jgi:hypothetical protein
LSAALPTTSRSHRRHAHAAADGDIPPGHLAFVAENGNEAEIVREYVDVVRGRHRQYDLEFAR